jgi:hypothetical protein
VVVVHTRIYFSVTNIAFKFYLFYLELNIKSFFLSYFQTLNSTLFWGFPWFSTPSQKKFALQMNIDVGYLKVGLFVSLHNFQRIKKIKITSQKLLLFVFNNFEIQFSQSSLEKCICKKGNQFFFKVALNFNSL